nr:membrane dipeptidase [uncultured Agathobaculum sp.]
MKLFDLHCDTLYECCETGKHLRENDLHVNRSGAQRYSHYAQFFALFCGARAPSGQRADGRKSLLDTLADLRLARMLKTAQRAFEENVDWLQPCRSARDMRQAADAGRSAAFLSIEGAELLPDRPDGLDVAYDAGVRMLTVTWNYRSRYGCPAAVDQDEGLTEAGRQLVRACAEKGVIVDVSHLSDRGFWDVCETIDGPFAASHSNMRALCRHPRNLTDRQFAEIVRRGGLVGVNLYAPFLVRRSAPVVDDVIAHIERMLSLGGERTVALGCDFDGCDELPAGIGGLGDMYRLADRMLALGYADSTVNALFYDNAAAFVKRML